MKAFLVFWSNISHISYLLSNFKWSLLFFIRCWYLLECFKFLLKFCLCINLYKFILVYQVGLCNAFVSFSSVLDVWGCYGVLFSLFFRSYFFVLTWITLFKFSLRTSVSYFLFLFALLEHLTWVIWLGFFLKAQHTSSKYEWMKVCHCIFFCFVGHSKAVRDICFNNAGTQFLSAAYDRYLKLWDTETGRLVFCGCCYLALF